MVAHYNKQGFRGRWLEDRIVQTNNMYRHRKIALITKVPTPTKVTRKGGQLVGAKYTEKSIVDFVGIYHTGKFIAFDTKECQQTSFPFKNVKQHQEEYLNDVKQLNGIAFILIFFRNFNELYLIHIDEYMTLKESLGRKSIPYQWFRDNKEIIKTQNGYYFDYLNAKDKNI
ncbi:Holliday junction resolvase RecU [Macrococcus armenti]|uniref:Holliday junction resolvase RecU n=1 Tax=Macrococcus armenti TaxID=2875764 RepID=UPI001CCF65F9|nr:Holliday junction resolvase RecU [Macrococcus armenti]UBH14873.1 Holliday junction resolvase RecU [Macrococcus armenti]UBH17233.1 Holliday junction resolvase RecU [Macrococcus armenti]UBH19498.1 Holliday junction resolvase RecU [Macrococcus armenti]